MPTGGVCILPLYHICIARPERVNKSRWVSHPSALLQISRAASFSQEPRLLYFQCSWGERAELLVHYETHLIRNTQLTVLHKCIAKILDPAVQFLFLRLRLSCYFAPQIINNKDKFCQYLNLYNLCSIISPVLRTR